MSSRRSRSPSPRSSSSRRSSSRRSPSPKRKRDRSASPKSTSAFSPSRQSARSRSRSPSPSPSSSSSSDTESHKASKKEKKSKKSKDKKKKHKKERKKEKEKEKEKQLKRKVKEAKALLQSVSSSSSSSSTHPPITPDDYYRKATEFRVWLHRTKSLFLDEIPKDKATSLFTHFIVDWNTGKLSDDYYKGMDSSMLPSASMTRHKWKFADKLTEQEKMKVASMRDDVDTATYHHTYSEEFLGKKSDPKPTHAPPSASTSATTVAGGIQAIRGPDILPSQDGHNKRVDRAHRAAQQAALEDQGFAKPTGREAVLAARAQRGANARAGQTREDGLEIGEKDLMGSGGKDDFQRMLQAKKAREASRADEASSKVAAYREKERQRMQAMLQGIGMADKYQV